MSQKIDSKYIKENVKCCFCDSTKLKRRHKQSFKSKVDTNCNFNDQKIHWRQFECENCNELTNVTNTDEEILHKDECAVLPFSCFNYCVEIMDDMVNLALFYKDTVKGDVIEDDIRDYHILFFEEFFLKHNIKASNSMENYWEIGFNKNYYDFKTFEEGLEIINKLMKQAGASYWKDLEQMDESDMEDMSFQENYMFF